MRRRNLGALVIALLALLAVAAPAAQALDTVHMNAINLGDATVSKKSANKNFGDTPTLAAHTSNNEPSMLAYITFGFGPFVAPNNSPYTTGTLSLYVVKGGPVCIYRAIMTFDEDALTWANKPAYNSHFEYPQNYGREVACLTLVQGWNHIDVGGDLRNYFHSEFNVISYAVESQAGNVILLSRNARRGVFGPQLEVTFTCTCQADG